MKDEIKQPPTKLKRWVFETGMKQHAVAKAWGLKANHACHLINGAKFPDERMMQIICDYTDGKITPQDILSDYRRITVDRLMELEKLYGMEEKSKI